MVAGATSTQRGKVAEPAEANPFRWLRNSSMPQRTIWPLEDGAREILRVPKRELIVHSPLRWTMAPSGFSPDYRCTTTSPEGPLKGVFAIIPM